MGERAWRAGRGSGVGEVCARQIRIEVEDEVAARTRALQRDPEPVLAVLMDGFHARLSELGRGLLGHRGEQPV